MGLRGIPGTTKFDSIDVLIAINHHYIRGNYNLPYPGINGISPDQFRNKLLMLSKHGTFVSGTQIAKAIDGNTDLPARSLIITFDDGLKEQYEIALPILNELNIPALFFINTINTEGIVSSVHKIHLLRSYVSPGDFSDELFSFIRTEALDGIDLDAAKAMGVSHYIYDDEVTASIKYILNFMLPVVSLDKFINNLFPKYFNEETVALELYMSPEQISHLADLGYLGSHGHEHLPLGQLPDESASFQIQRSQEIIKNVTGKDAVAFSYPYGSDEASNGLSAQLNAAGFKFAFTMKRNANEVIVDPFYLGRFDNNDMPLGKANKFPDSVNIFDHLKQQHAG